MVKSDFDVEFMGLRFDDVEVLRETLRRIEATLGAHDHHARALGSLCLAFSALDWVITELHVPLLQCSEAQAVCMVDESISRRCATAIKLLHLEDELPQDWLEWAVALLRRADGELARLRNRLVHDSYLISEANTVRIDRRVKLGKPQSRQKAAVTYNTEHAAPLAELERVSECVSTVASALGAAKCNLLAWRQTGLPPVLDPQWLPASKPNSRCLNYQASADALEKPIFPLKYEFD